MSAIASRGLCTGPEKPCCRAQAFFALAGVACFRVDWLNRRTSGRAGWLRTTDSWRAEALEFAELTAVGKRPGKMSSCCRKWHTTPISNSFVLGIDFSLRVSSGAIIAPRMLMLT